MSEALDARARLLLEAVLTGERDASDPEVVALARESAEFDRRLSTLRETAALLDRTAEEARETRRAAEELTSAPGEDALLRLPRSPPRSARLAWIALAAAAAALLAFVLLRGRRDGEREAPVWIGADTVHVLRPRDQVDSYAPFVWEGRLPTRGEYRITIVDATDAGAGAILLQHRTVDTRWTPTPEELARLPARIRVDVAVYVDDMMIALDSAPARR